MTFVLSQKSLDRLVGVHPDLVKVVKRAIEISTVDFMMVEGVRSDEQCYINYGKGRTVAQLAAKGVPAKYANPKAGKVTWLNHPLLSNHRKKPDGYGHAVDMLPAPYDWKVGSNFTNMAHAMKQAANELGVKIVWGGDWTSSKDYPHFELA
jgi:peptidoglycan L-alanyl-D-glutamate endopeptidase CwlK